MHKLITFFIALATLSLCAQKDSLKPEVGSRAAGFSVMLNTNVLKNFPFPYQKRIVLLHFWDGSPASRPGNYHMKSLAERFKNKMYKTADGFEIISIAVKLERRPWLEIIKADTLSLFVNGLAKDYSDEVCKKYGISDAPHDILIDEAGVILAIDPGMKTLETLLGERKVFQPARKDLTGLLAKSLNRDETIKGNKLFLFNAYGDTLGQSATTASGHFSFYNVRLQQDLVLKVADQSQMDVSDPVAIYSPSGAFLMNGTVKGDYCVFNIPYRVAYSLLDVNAASAPNEQMNLVTNMEFSKTGTFQLSAKDEEELNKLASILVKNKALNVEFKTHTDTQLSESGAMDATTRQMQLIRNYFLKKGIAASRIKGIPKGKSNPARPCVGAKCSDEDNRQNRRVEFLIS